MERDDQLIANPRGLFGRKVIYTSASEITAGNLMEELNRALVVHNVNRAQIAYLYNYYKGKQPILHRVKTYRPEIKNTIVENHAQEIVSFKTGYLLGEPCTYVRRGDDDTVSDKVKRLNEFMFSSDKASCDRELADWFHICGTSYRMELPSRDEGVEIETLDPRYVFVVYNGGFGKHPVMGVTYLFERGGGAVYSIYTPDCYYEVRGGAITAENPHTLGCVPIIEYPANTARLGAFEIVLPLLDGLNNAMSNRMDGLEQFVQSFIKFINCDIDEDKFIALKDLGAIKVKSTDGQQADVEIVTSELNQTQVQVLVSYMYDQVLSICGVPSTTSGGASTSDTGSAVILRDGWQQAEARARDTELMFKRAEKRFLRLSLNILSVTDGLSLKLSDIDIKFTRRQHDNLLSKAQSLQAMLASGISPEVSIAQCGLFNDPQDVYAQSKDFLEKWKPQPADDK